jgi:hypothetical protein
MCVYTFLFVSVITFKIPALLLTPESKFISSRP